MPSDEAICHDPPCQFFKAHKDEFERRCGTQRAELDELKLCYVDLQALKDGQAQTLKTQDEFRENHNALNVTLAEIMLVLKQHSEMMVDLKKGQQNMERRHLTEDNVRVLLSEFSKSYLDEKAVEVRIQSAMAKAVKEAREMSTTNLWKLVSISATGSSLLITIFFIMYKILTRTMP